MSYYILCRMTYRLALAIVSHGNTYGFQSANAGGRAPGFPPAWSSRHRHPQPDRRRAPAGAHLSQRRAAAPRGSGDQAAGGHDAVTSITQEHLNRDLANNSYWFLS